MELVSGMFIMKRIKRKNYKRWVHYGIRGPLSSIETLCGKKGDPCSAFGEYGYVTQNEDEVTCKHCLEAMK
jgi:hypothetical protein